MNRLVLLLVVPFALWAQPEFFGYFESEMDILQLGTEKYNFGYNKFRLGVETRPNDNVLIGANINAQQYWGKTSWNLFDFVPGYTENGYTMNFVLPDTIMLDNMYMRISFPLLDLTLGRQQISPGVGYAWNPTDIFNHKSLMDPSYEQTGVDVIRLYMPLGNRSSFNSIIQPSDNFGSSTVQFALGAGWGRFDFGMNLTKQFASSNTTPILGDPFVEERFLLGGSMVGEVLGWGVWTELAYNKLIATAFPPWSSIAYPEVHKPYSEILIGLDHTFDNSVYLLAEFLHNEHGVGKLSDLTVNDYLVNLGGSTHSLMQDYGFFYLMLPPMDYITLSALAIANFNDNSGTIAPQFDWNAFENTNISLQASGSWGASDTEFGLQDWGLRLRLLSNF
jgi:hypothetical protein